MFKIRIYVQFANNLSINEITDFMVIKVHHLIHGIPKSISDLNFVTTDTPP